MFILGLSIFTIIVSIVRIAGARFPNGSVDSAWVVFWLQLEAAVAVIIVSITSYRSLFVKEKSTDNKKSPSPRDVRSSTGYRRKLWSRETREEGGKKGGVEMPTLPDPTLTGMRTVIGRARGYDDRFSRSEDFFLPATAKGIVVTREADVRMVCPFYVLPFFLGKLFVCAVCVRISADGNRRPHGVEMGILSGSRIGCDWV